MLPGRDPTYDTLRGLAVYLMIQGNLAPYLQRQPYAPLWQWDVNVNSYGAALFILVAGMLVARTARDRAYRLRHYLLRGLALWAAAAVVIDVGMFRIYPFTSFEVLYLTGMSLPLVFASQRLPRWGRLGLVLLLFVATPPLQAWLGYRWYPTEVPLADAVPYLFEASRIFRHWLIDGWFPVFPWLGFALLGGLLDDLSVELTPSRLRRGLVVAGMALVVVGLGLWAVYDGPLYIRNGLSERTYPPTSAYLATATGQAFLLLALVGRWPALNVWRPLALLGRASLFLYLLHFAIAAWILEPFVTPQLDAVGYLVSIHLAVVAVVGLAWGLDRLRRLWPDRPRWLAYVFGF